MTKWNSNWSANRPGDHRPGDHRPGDDRETGHRWEQGMGEGLGAPLDQRRNLADYAQPDSGSFGRYDLGDRNPSQGFTGGYGGGVSERRPDDVGGAYATSRVNHTGRGPRGWQRNDARIEDDVCEALTRAPHIDATDIEVKVAGGEVTLSGEVDSRATKRAAEALVEGCHGVRDVHNSLRVRETPIFRE